jgi:hypothetical protein
MLTTTTLEVHAMRTVIDQSAAFIRSLWRSSPPLTAVGLGMFVVLAASLAGLAVDPRVITGAPAWLKPSKFAISSAIYALTLAWISSHVQDRPRLVRIVGWGTAIIVTLEVALIDLQAARGLSSHFNIGTPLDAAIFTTMGVAILGAWGLAIALTVALFRRRFPDRALGWSLRIGMLITVLGSGMGGLMTQPTEAQMESVRATHRLPVAGAHTVGAPDGGAGLPGTGWSREHGDLRVPHFFGLHAIQLVPLFAFLAGRPIVSARKREQAALIAGVSYAILFVILLVQALSGESVVAPAAATLGMLGAWLAATLAGLAFALAPDRNGSGARTVDAPVLR